MAKAELLLKTALCCMASDGSIAPEEMDMLNKVIVSNTIFNTIDSEELLKEYESTLIAKGMTFLNEYLSELAAAQLSSTEAMEIVEVAFKTIEADNEIEYSEIAFFKKIRACLPLSDSEILAKWPDKEDYLLPDIMDKIPFVIDLSSISFNNLE